MNIDQNSRHTGELLKAVVKESGISIEVLMRKLGYSSRNTYYRHIETPDLSEIILKRYGKVLKHDFLADYWEENDKSVFMETPAGYLSAPVSIEEAISQRDFYWSKYQEQLEMYRKLTLKYEELLRQVPKK